MNRSDLSRNRYMLHGPLARKGYDWWWHSFTAYHQISGEAKAFFVEFFVINPELDPKHVVFGQLPENQKAGRKPCYLMIKVGTWGKDAKQLHAFYPLDKVAISQGKLKIIAGDCILSEKHTCGSVKVSKAAAENHPEYMTDAGTMEWNLKIQKQIAYHVGYGASRFFRALNAFEMFWHAEGMKTQYTGTILFDGEVYDVIPEKSYGYADKNWGQDFTSPWVWLSSCHLTSLKTGRELKNSVLEVGGGRPKVFHFPLNRKLLIDLYYQGKEYEFNFSKFWTFPVTKFKAWEEDRYIRWEIVTRNRTHCLRIKCRCLKSEMLWIRYEAPDGRKRHNRLWNGGTGEGIVELYRKDQGRLVLMDRMDMKNVGCEYGEYDSKLE